MRKYQQLLLIIISAFSLTLLLVYRHEYNRLRYVLEVFNFFGKPCNFSELIETGSILNHHDWGPDPVWNQEDNIYVYSSYLTEQKQLKSLIVKSPKIDHAKSCYVWFEDNEWKPEVAKLAYQNIFINNNYEGYYYICSWTKSTVPYAVSYSKKHSSKNLILTNSNSSNTQFKVTMCVPPTKFLTKRFLSEFLSYHSLIGIDSFVVYSTALPHITIKLVTTLSQKLNFNISFYTYNFPDYVDEIIREDCKLRTLGQSNYSMVMEVNEYLVPQQDKDVYNALQTKADIIRLPVEKFCINEQIATKPIALQNVHLISDDEKLVKTINVNNGRKPNGGKNDFESAGQIIVQKYVFCLDVISKVYEHKAILKFADDFIKSTLFQMNLHHFL